MSESEGDFKLITQVLAGNAKKRRIFFLTACFNGQRKVDRQVGFLRDGKLRIRAMFDFCF